MNNNKKLLGVDVDSTTLNSTEDWWRWLKYMAQDNDLPWTMKEYAERGNTIDYNISKHFPPMKNRNVEPMDFWRQDGVYDTIQPIEGAVECIKYLMDSYNIVFVTHNKGNGGRSKFNNLDRLFGRENFGYIVTKEKYLVRMDYMIDDRNDFLNACVGHDIQPIRIASPFLQYEKSAPEIIKLDNWEEIAFHLTHPVMCLFNVHC